MKKEWLRPELKDLNVNETKTNICSECGCDLDSPAKASLTPEEALWWPHKPGCSKPDNKPAAPGFGPVGSVTPELDATPIS